MNDSFDIKISKHFLITSVLILLVNGALELYYIRFLSTDFNYIGFKYNFDLFKYFEAKVLLFLFLILSWYIFKKSRFLYSIFVLLLLFFFIPNAILFAYMDHIRGPIYSISILLSTFTIISPSKLSITTIYTSKYLKPLLILSIALLFLAPIFLIYKSNFNMDALVLKNIYETRATFDGNISSLQNYLYNWEVKIIIPVMLAFFLIKKKYLFAVFSFLILIYLFIISGNKSVYATTLITLFFYFIGGISYVKKTTLFTLGLLFILIALPIIDIYILHGILLRGTIVMRVFFFPALLNYCYFDFFQNLHLYFSENHFFNLFFESPLEIKSAYLISQKYFNTNEMYANNGIISDGFMNLGYAGVFILSIIFSLLFMFFNSVKLDARYFGVFFSIVFFFLSTPVFTIFSTGGIWILILFTLIIMASRKSILYPNITS